VEQNSGKNKEDEEEHSEKLHELKVEDIKCFLWRVEIVLDS